MTLSARESPAQPPKPYEILHILGTAGQAGTGISRMVKVLAAHLDPSEFRVSACFLAGPGPWIGRLTAAGVTTWRLPWSRPRDLPGAIRFWRLLRSHRPDLVHCHFGGRAVWRLARWTSGAPLVVHAHGRVRHELDFEPVIRRLRDADAVIATSHAVAAFVDASSVRVIHPPLAMPPAPTHPESSVVGAAGRLVPIKGYDNLIRAFAGLCRIRPGVRLEIAGEGPWRTALEAEVHRLGLDSVVTFLGWVDHLPMVMRRWSVFVQPAMEEALGITVLEAMASGLPVVASDVGGLPEIVEPGVTGMLVRRGDEGALISAMDSLLGNDSLRVTLGRAARERAREFGQARFAEQVASVYRSLIAPPDPCSDPSSGQPSHPT
ncbi:MAG TPA: glycosyltransferase family 4 protein [Acidimicrobiia bacterium]